MPHVEEELIWDDVLRAVQADSPNVYRAWFETLPPGRIEAGELRVVVSDPARARYLREECGPVFVQAVMRVAGRMVPVHFLEPDEPSVSFTPRLFSQLHLTPDYTFDEFVVGMSNRMAHAACQAVTTQLGTLYNPLFIHGGSGLGKTHLLQATCAELLRLNPRMNVIYVSCDEFMSEFIRAVRTGEVAPFKDSVRSADVLVIDDVQFLRKGEESQDELFHTFNSLYQSRRQLILSADLPPSGIPTLEDRLVSRFNWGLVVQLDAPNRETRCAILQKKALLRGFDIPVEVLDYLAERISANIRLLEGALTRLIGESQLAGKPMNTDTVRELFPPVEPRTPKIPEILDLVAAYYGVKLQDLIGRKRTRSISHPRQVAMYLARRLTRLSLEEIGAHFGGRDHSTVLHAERTVAAECATDTRVADNLTHLSRTLERQAASAANRLAD